MKGPFDKIMANKMIINLNVFGTLIKKLLWAI